MKLVTDTIATLHTVPQYNCVTFPHCASSVQKDNPLKISVDYKAVSLRVCDQNGVNLDFECVMFNWETITSWKATDGGESGNMFVFEFTRPNGKLKTVKLYSELCDQMLACFEKISSERTM